MLEKAIKNYSKDQVEQKVATKQNDCIIVNSRAKRSTCVTNPEHVICPTFKSECLEH